LSTACAKFDQQEQLGGANWVVVTGIKKIDKTKHQSLCVQRNFGLRVFGFGQLIIRPRVQEAVVARYFPLPSQLEFYIDVRL
jgi:hypothetical protein